MSTNCSASLFTTPSTVVPTYAQENIYYNFVAVLGSGTAANWEAVIQYATSSLLIFNIWGALMLVFLVFAVIPLMVCVCCNCCRNGPERRAPACGCSGFVFPTISFVLNWLSLFGLVIAVPLTLHKAGDVLNYWPCVASAGFDSAFDVVNNVKGVSDLVYDQVLGGIDSTVVLFDNILDEVSGKTSTIQTTIDDMSSDLYSGCTTITDSDAYKQLKAATGSSFDGIDCSTLKSIAPDVDDKAKEVQQTVTDARKQVVEANQTATEDLGNAISEVDSVIQNAHDTLSEYQSYLLDTVVTIDFDSHRNGTQMSRSEFWGKVFPGTLLVSSVW